MPSDPGPFQARPWQGLEGLRTSDAHWREVYGQSAVDRLCNSPDWGLAYAEAYAAPDEELFGWSILDEHQVPVGWAGFRHEASRGRLALPRALHFTDGTFDSDYLDFLLRPDMAPKALAYLLEALAGRRSIQAVVLAGVPESSPTLEILRSELDRRGWPRREHGVACLAAPLPETFEAYVAGLKPRMRSKVRSAMKKAQEAEARFVWCDDPGNLESDLAGLFELHTLRWNSVDQAGSFADARRRRFYAALAETYLARGNLRFARLDWDGRPVAYQFGLVEGPTYYQLQEGFHPQFGGVRAATALRGMAVQRMIDEGFRSYDFMAGDTRHKRDWGGKERPCTTVAFALPRVRARVAYGLRALADRSVKR